MRTGATDAKGVPTWLQGNPAVEQTGNPEETPPCNEPDRILHLTACTLTRVMCQGEWGTDSPETCFRG